MRVFVAGATGALGVPVVNLLVGAGHDVTGLTRSAAKVPTIERLGARAAVGDALDAAAVERAVGEAKPEAIVSLLTRLPKRGPTSIRHLRPNARVHREGTANIVRAARTAGVDRVVAESVIFRYGYGTLPPMLREDQPAAEPPAFVKGALDAVGALESSVIGAGGVVLRYGVFYGRDTGHQQFMAKMLARGMMLLPGGEVGSLSWIHVDDAATATVAALERGRSGEVYNICDDEPVSFWGFTGKLAKVIGAKPPKAIPIAVAEKVARYPALFMTSTITMSNEKAKRELGWTPRYASVGDGLKEMSRSA
ncbi:MAG: NAD-dependent epimerase/dehydratase family protein [Actinomycetota bacterium]